MRLEDLPSAMGIDGPVSLAFAAIMIALAAVVIFFIAYYRTIVSIASFAYPNAKLKALGTPYVRREEAERLMESANIQDALAELIEAGYSHKGTGESDLDELELGLERGFITTVVNGYRSLPESARPFFKGYLLRLEARQLKELLRTASTGGDVKSAAGRMVPILHLKQDAIAALGEARDVEDVVSTLQSTRFGEVLAESVGHGKGEAMLWELALDRFVYDEMRRGRYEVDVDLARSVGQFLGRYADIMNVKIVLRAKAMGYGKEQIGELLLPYGRELARWRLDNMMDGAATSDVLGELEGTRYATCLHEAQSGSGKENVYSLEHALDQELLKIARELASQDILTVGPAIHFMVAKEFEMRNVRTMLRAISRRMTLERVEPLLVLEVAA